jgi:hypothetical protein
VLLTLIGMLVCIAKNDSFALTADSISKGRGVQSPSVNNSDSTAPAKTAITSAHFDTLAGPLPPVLKGDSALYLVISDIEVPAGSTVTIQPGARLLFREFAGLHVQGKLLAQGMKERPIVFTSEKDHAVNPATSLYANPYDWNGVYIHSEAVGTVIEFAQIAYSVYGIVSDTKFIRLNQVSARMNGKSNVAIEGKELVAVAGIFNYAASSADLKNAGIALKTAADPNAMKRSIVRYTGFTVLLAGGAGAVVYGLRWKKDQYDLSTMSVDDPQNLSSINESDWLAKRDRRNRDRLNTAIGAAATALGAIGFTLSFTF